MWKVMTGRRYAHCQQALLTVKGFGSGISSLCSVRSVVRPCRLSSTLSNEEEEPRESMPFDVLIVGGGPAGLAASIRIKQLCKSTGKDLSVCLIDKGSEIGSHILSGNVLDPKALHELFPELSSTNNHWSTELLATTGSYATPVTSDNFYVLTAAGGSYHIPHLLLPPQLDNAGNYVVSLSQICRWLAQKAEELGVEIFPGFGASDVLLSSSSSDTSTSTTTTTTTSISAAAVQGVVTRDVGVCKDGVNRKSNFSRGMELRARQTLLAEGARGSCTEQVVQQFQLRTRKTQEQHGGGGGGQVVVQVQPQTYALGLKEVWQVPPEKCQPGLVQHTLGFPLQSSPFDKVFGGSFLYHQEPDLVLVGLVMGLDYANPYLNPYQEFQRYKTHPAIRSHLEGGTCVSYGARVLNEGGFHSIPKLTFPGGALLGCSAGFLNAVKIKGTHTAIKSGILAAEAAHEALTAGGRESVAATGELPPNEEPIELTAYETAVRNSWIHEELYQVRNCHAAFSRWGVGGGLTYTGMAAFITKGREPWTLTHNKLDSDATSEAANFQPIDYPAADGKLTFDLLTNLQRSGVYHEDDQPSHLRIKPDFQHIPESISLQKYAAPESRFCPAAVYEFVDEKLVINAQNCIHCKTCSIKTPGEYIEWTVPEGGGGPQYQVM